MKRIFQVLLVTLFVGVSMAATAQYAAIRGQVIDDASGETIIGAAVVIEGTTTGASTDLDGKFEIKVAPGTYNVVSTFISYSPIKIEGVEVKEGEVTALGTIRMGANTEQLKEVVVTAKAVQNTEAALVTMKRKSANVIDGISAASFKKIGDSDAASAMSRVTGVSIEGGKYVFVRGLGDRYTKTTVNGMEIPGLDPDRNSVQLDIFPTNVIDNIVVSKSFTADLPADFTGGAVDIALKDFPDRKTMDVGVSLGYNPNMHFQSDALTQRTSSTDFLGFDGGLRDLPFDDSKSFPTINDAIGNPTGEDAQRFEAALRDFNTQMAGTRAGNLLNTGLSFAVSNQRALGERTLGYSFSLGYRNELQYFQDAQYNLYGKPTDPSETELELFEEQVGDFATQNTLVSAMAGVSLKDDKSKYRLNLLHLQNGESKTGEFDFTANNRGTVFTAKQFNIEYSERSLTNLLLSGNTVAGANNEWNYTWKFAPTRSVLNDPDIRFSRVRTGGGTPFSTEVGLPERIWRELEEYNLPAKFDVVRDLTISQRDAKLKFGASTVYKERDFNIYNFQVIPGNTTFGSNPSPNDIFVEENLYDSENPQGVRVNPQFVPINPNQFNSKAVNVGAYGSLEFQPTPLLKAIVGLRAELYQQYYTGTNQTGSIVLDNELLLDDLDLFPTLNLIYNVQENQNLRFSFSRTIARPSFKELSYAEILDPITGRTFVGGLFTEVATVGGETQALWDGKLQSTRINNIDVRWELFNGIGQSVSVSAFYKGFSKPIEMVQFLSDPGSFQARNVGDATVLGTEIEVRQSLALISPKLEQFSLVGNLTLTRSSIDMSTSELRSRQLSAREGEEVEDTRAMAGQAPYLINTSLLYATKDRATDIGISYNVQGRTLQFVGFGNQTDVFSVPFHSLNIKGSHKFGEDNRWKASLKVTNLLNDAREQVFSSFQAEDQFFTRLLPMRTISVGISYKIF